MMIDEDMETVELECTDEHYAWLVKMAQEQDCTVSEVVVKILMKQLKQEADRLCVTEED